MYYVDFNGRYPDVIDCSRDMTKYHEVKAEGGHNLRKFKNYSNRCRLVYVVFF